jgi:hypothetical protein
MDPSQRSSRVVHIGALDGLARVAVLPSKSSMYNQPNASELPHPTDWPDKSHAQYSEEGERVHGNVLFVFWIGR